MNTVVELKDVTRKFGDFTAVDRVSFDVRQGEIFGFLGPNGSGKSTTIKMITGIISPTEGSVTVLGYDTVKHHRDVVKGIGYMSQKFSLYPSLTVEENLKFYAGVYGMKKSRRIERIRELLKRQELHDKRDRLTSELSVGWKQRLALTCAMLHEPEIVFLDEPTGGVDPSSRRVFWDIITDMAGDGATIFVTTHYMEEAEYCDRIGLINRGELVALGSPEELKKRVIRGKVFEANLPDALAHMDKIAEVEDVEDVTIYGRDLHVILSESVSDADKVFQRIRSAGAPVENYAEIPPSLEDVFIALMETGG